MRIIRLPPTVSVSFFGEHWFTVPRWLAVRIFIHQPDRPVGPWLWRRWVDLTGISFQRGDDGT